MKTQHRLCICCQKPLKGRLDKRFCDDYCRNHFHNSIKAPENNLVRNVNNALTKNRRILKNAYRSTPPPHQVLMDDLIQEGYIFRYHTHYLKEEPEGYGCYDYGVVMQQSGVCTIVQCNGPVVVKARQNHLMAQQGA